MRIKALRTLKTVFKLFKAILAITALIPAVVFLYIRYRLSLARARRSVYRELRALGVPEEHAKELLDIVAPDLGGLREWMNLKRLGSSS